EEEASIREPRQAGCVLQEELRVTAERWNFVRVPPRRLRNRINDVGAVRANARAALGSERPGEPAVCAARRARSRAARRSRRTTRPRCRRSRTAGLRTSDA